MKNLILVLSLSLVSASAFAKRLAPAEIKPVVQKETEFTLQSEQSDCVTEKVCGQQVFLVSKNLKTGNVNWVTALYQVTFDSKLETDIQTIYPTSLKVRKNRATVIDERGSTYVTNIKSGELVSPLKSIIYPAKK